MPESNIRIVSGPEFRAAADALRLVNEALPREFRKRMMNAVKPAVAAARDKVRTLPVAGASGSTGLRRRVARGVRIRASTGTSARLRVVTSMANPTEAVIPRGMDSAAGWRHPVYGNRENWVTERPLVPGWFVETIADSRRDVENALQDALQWAADQVDNVS